MIYCEICGKMGLSHRCSPRTLKAIDAAHAAAELEPGTGHERKRSFDIRLKEGFDLLCGDADKDDEFHRNTES
jgi:hypothetical protein